jgi:hypothetical protein
MQAFLLPQRSRILDLSVPCCKTCNAIKSVLQKSPIHMSPFRKFRAHAVEPEKWLRQLLWEAWITVVLPRFGTFSLCSSTTRQLSNSKEPNRGSTSLDVTILPMTEFLIASSTVSSKLPNRYLSRSEPQRSVDESHVM